MNDNLLQVYQPSKVSEAMQIAEMLAETEFVPDNFRGKPNKVFFAMMHGAQLGLSPIHALQEIAFIKGRFCMYGDSLLAVIMGHPEFEYIKETYENNTATCVLKRKNRPAHTETFSIEDAKRADLWGKNVWAKYPKRMLKMRARGFAIRDVFADFLRGLKSREEVQDYDTPIENITPDLEPDNIIDATPVEHEINQPSEDEFSSRLQKLIKLHHIDETVIQRWIKAANVNAISELNPEQTQGCLNWIYKKYPAEELEQPPSEKPVDRAQALADELKAKDSKTNPVAKAA